MTEFDDFLTVDSSKPGQQPSFDDVSAVERELSAPVSSRTPAAEAPRPDLSTEILLKIADELSSIRGELVSLKSKIGEVIVGEAAPKKPVEEETEPQEEAGSTGGFFDEEEDETIALTGDELDNILNTADFTTEEASETEEPIELDSEALVEEPPALADDGDLLDESLLPETGEYDSSSVFEPAIEEVHIGEADSFDRIGDESSDLSLPVDEGVTPLTPAPEDTSYLEESETLDLGGGAPLADEPLVEPDLSEFDLEPEDLEPRLEIDEELPLASADPGIAEPIEELTLDIEAGPDYIEESDLEKEASDCGIR